MKLPITIEYNSGEQATYVAAPPEWAKWEMKFGKTITEARNNVGISDLLFLAYNAMKREAAGKPVKSYEIWMETVSDVTVGDDNPKAIQSDQ
jgi:predicted RNase H-like HicB family nuclease